MRQGSTIARTAPLPGVEIPSSAVRRGLEVYALEGLSRNGASEEPSVQLCFSQWHKPAAKKIGVTTGKGRSGGRGTVLQVNCFQCEGGPARKLISANQKRA